MPATTHFLRQSIGFTGPQHAFLAAEAERLGISLADVVRRIVDEYREKREATQRGA